MSADATARRSRIAAALVGVGLAALAVALVLIRDRAAEVADARPVHVHGLGVNPADGSLFIATHTGMWRLAEGDDRAQPVGDNHQDTMGFTVVGADRFLGSGHPDLRTDLPPHLGLIESTDAGASWDSVSLLGEADFHVLRFAGDRLYGYDATNGRLLVSNDRGRAWTVLETPGQILDLAVHPGDSRSLVAATDRGLVRSLDGGATWRRIGSKLGYLAWPSADRLYLVDEGGTVFVSSDGGTVLERAGSIGGEPAALLAVETELLVALHDGSIRRSVDAGVSWDSRSTP